MAVLPEEVRSKIYRKTLTAWAHAAAATVFPVGTMSPHRRLER